MASSPKGFLQHSHCRSSSHVTLSWPHSPFLSPSNVCPFPKGGQRRQGLVREGRVVRKRVVLQVVPGFLGCVLLTPKSPNSSLLFSCSPRALPSTEEQQRGRDAPWLWVARAGGNWGWGNRVRLPLWEQPGLGVGGDEEGKSRNAAPFQPSLPGPMTFVVVPQEALLGRLWGLCQARSW